MTIAKLLLTAVLAGAAPEPAQYFAVTVVDAETGRGVPLVELRTVNGIRHVTDNNGIVAFHEPGLMGKDVFFYVSSHGYEFAKDGFGFRGKTLRVVPGGTAKLSIQRINIAERLYRITGGGGYRDSLLVGAKVSVKEPALNALVLGSDSVVNVIYRNKIHWFWGDTTRPSYPLGNFHVPGATSLLPGQGGSIRTRASTFNTSRMPRASPRKWPACPAKARPGSPRPPRSPTNKAANGWSAPMSKFNRP